MQSSKGCVRLRDALKCIGMRLGGYLYSRVKPLEESNCNVHYAMNYVSSTDSLGHLCICRIGQTVSTPGLASNIVAVNTTTVVTWLCK